MNASLSWIKAYVKDLETTPQEFFDKMTMSGTKVEGYECRDKNLEKIFVGQIESIERHPDADKLIVCQVNIKDQMVQIVTGASNVAVGDKVPVVLDGGKVAGGHDGSALPEEGIKIKKGKLRGIESFGMMCSIEELGSSRDMYPEAPEEGIYIFPEDTLVGADAVEVLGLHDTVFEFEVTSNRVDCFSVVGIAREVAATYQKEFQTPVISVKGSGDSIENYLKVSVENETLCPRFIAKVIKNIKIAPSPIWMQRRLASCGIRPINNLVDITNYVMEEYGQPMHAYDYDQLADQKIVVKCAKDGDTFTTLDGQERTLDASFLMINDGEKAVGIAGVMGGENSMITDDVKTMVFEAACFDGTNVRLSSKKVGLRTDASGKFEKGVDPENTAIAMQRACQLIEELGAGEVVDGIIDIYPNPVVTKEIPLDVEKINKMLGLTLTKDEMLAYLLKIEIAYDESRQMLQIPSFRQDLVCLADIAEEVARFFGYDKIPTTLPSGESTLGTKPMKLRVEDIAKDVAEFAGFSQAMSFSFESPKVFDKLLLPAEDALRNAIVIQNPLGEDFSIMRTTTIPAMLTSLANNYNRRNKNVRLYELSNIYLAKAFPLTELPDERMQLTFGMYGEGDFFTLKGVVEEYLAKLGMKEKILFDASICSSFLHPGRKASISYKGDTVGYIGEVHPDVSEAFGINERVYVAVLDIKQLVPFTSFDYKYEQIARYPAMTRDISLMLKKEIPVGKIEEIIAKKGGAILESYHLFDRYEGNQIAEGYKSVAYSIVFRAKERTLEEKEVNDKMTRILESLKTEGIKLRQ